MVTCLEQGADLHMAQLMPLPLTVSCFSKIQSGFTFLVLAHLGSPGKIAVKRVCVCVVGRQEEHLAAKIQWRGVGAAICLQRSADCLQMVQLMPLHPKTPSSLASSEPRLVLPFWHRLTRVVLEKRPLNRCSSSSNSSHWRQQWQRA